MKIAEITGGTQLTPEKARIDALTKQKERVTDALKAERDRQKRAKATAALQTAQKNLMLLSK